MATHPSVAIIIIGEEILKGQTLDTNSHFLCRELYKCGIKVSRVSVIPDDVDVIAAEISDNIENSSFVFTSGGIGPTHDDVTYEGIAKAFSEKLVLNKDLQKVLLNVCRRMGFNESGVEKMSHVPESSEINYIFTAGKMSFPVISVKNVFIFGGIPSYLEYAFTELKPLFCNESNKYFCKELYVDSNEFTIMNVLNAAVKEYDGIVKFGSYPDVENDFYQVKLTLEADSDEAITAAEAFLRSHLPHNTVVTKSPPSSKEALSFLENLLLKRSDVLAKTVEASLGVLRECYDKYPLKAVCLSFNGGKDCTALLHLIYMYLTKYLPDRSEKLKVLYVRSRQPFPEIEDFIQLCVQR